MAKRLPRIQNKGGDTVQWREIQAQERVRKARKRVCESIRNMAYDKIQNENQLIAGRVERILTRSKESRVQDLRNRNWLLRQKANACTAIRNQTTQAIVSENQKLVVRLSNVKSTYGYGKLNSKAREKKRKTLKNQKLSAAFAAEAKEICEKKLQPCSKLSEQSETYLTRKFVLKDPKFKPGDIAENANIKRGMGILNEPKNDILRIYQRGRFLNGAPVVVSVYESTIASNKLKLALYDQSSCTTQVLKVSTQDVVVVFGKQAGEELLQPENRKELCECLVDKIRVFNCNGENRLVLADVGSFGSGPSSILAGKRGMMAKLNKIKIPGGFDKNIPFESSTQVEQTVKCMTNYANARGDHYPSFSCLKSPVGTLPDPMESQKEVHLDILDGLDASPRARSVPLASQPTYENHSPSIEPIQQAHVPVLPPYCQKLPTDGLELRFVPLEKDMMYTVQVRDISTDIFEWLDITLLLRPSLLLDISLELSRNGCCSDLVLSYIDDDVSQWQSALK